MAPSPQTASASPTPSFPIPAALQDLEREPLNLFPYPLGFADDDEATRADSFDRLAAFLEDGNRALINGGINNFECESDDDDDLHGYEEWNDKERIQALYTLVRKSSSLSISTRKRVVTAVCRAVSAMTSILRKAGHDPNARNITVGGSYVVAQSFRDAFACHLYMLYTIMIFMESEIKAGKLLETSGRSGGGGGNGAKRAKSSSNNRQNRIQLETQHTQQSREMCAEAMTTATRTMAQFKSKLWRRGVPDESVVYLPCRIAYQMLENATGVQHRKLASADLAMEIIAVTVESLGGGDTGVVGLGLNVGHASGDGGGCDCSLLGTIVSALVDMLHSFEHLAPLIAELCCIESSLATSPSLSLRQKDRLAIELLREVGRLDANTASATETVTSGKASGIKYVAPFINEIAEKKPHLVLEHISLITPHLHSEPYYLRSAIITAIGHILTQVVEVDDDRDHNTDDGCHTSNGDSNLMADVGRMKSKKLSDIRESLYDLLIEHVYDVSSYTRVAVLKTWTTLIKSQSLPVDKLASVTELGIDRLQDKTVMVRRSAMQILACVLEHNPFMKSLRPKLYEEKMCEVRGFILENLPGHIKEAMDDAVKELDDDDEDDEFERVEIENAAIKTTIAEREGQVKDQDTGEDVDGGKIDVELSTKLKAYTFLKSAIDFIAIFEKSNDAFQSMLLSSNKSDVTEALKFFVKATHFELPCAVTGIKQALSLMWSDEKTVQDEVLSSFIDIFIFCTNDDDEREELPSTQIVEKFLKLVGKATVSELASIEEAISRLVKDEVIPSEVFSRLWSIAARAPRQPRSVAMMILSMGATADPGIVDSTSRLRHLLEAGLGDYTEKHKDWTTAKSAAYALQRVSRVKPDPTSSKFLVLEQIVKRLCIVIQGDWCDDRNEDDSRAWFAAAEEAINAIFAVCPAPEQVAQLIINNLEGSTFGFSRGEKKTSCHSLQLSRFFFVTGHISLKLLVYTEALSGAVRNANAARTVAKQEEADKANAGRDVDDERNDDIEAELGLAQEAEAETENKVAEISEKEIVGRGMIGLFTPLLVQIVANESGRFSSEILMQTSVLALCKFMCISRSFCEKHLPLLFTALSNAPSQDITLRANTVIALGDLAFRFPNEVEPYTPRLYAFLRDNSTRVRLHTLMVLTHLILNDMIKVKGQVCEIALCLRDEESSIRDMVRLLFHELSKRSNNPIYNLLPEIVSRLSSMSVKKEDFRCIMSFLLGFIKKERQVEMIVEKLCQRFSKCTSISQKANISYCLAQLKTNEKSIKILNDNFKLYKDALFDEDVLKNFTLIVSKVKKFAKPETRQYIEEWEGKLIEHSAMGMENESANKKAQNAKKRAAKRAHLTRVKESHRRADSSEEEEFSQSENEDDDNVVDDEKPESHEFDVGDDENLVTSRETDRKETSPAKRQNRRRNQRSVLANIQ